MSSGSRSKTTSGDGEPTAAEQVAFLRGLAFAYQRASEALGGDATRDVSAHRVSQLRAKLDGAAKMALAASGAA